jgi:hypothetical protein
LLAPGDSRQLPQTADNIPVASAQPGDHCPFLNRADSRCGEKFSLDHLDHAYHYCFDRYSTCAIYHQLLAERQVRRITANATNPINRAPLVQLTLGKPALEKSRFEKSPLEKSPLGRAA